MELVMTKACCQPQQKKPQVVFAGATVRVEACELAAHMVRMPASVVSCLWL